MDGCPEIRAYGKLADAAVNSLSELLDEVEILRHERDLCAANQSRLLDEVERLRYLEEDRTRLLKRIAQLEAAIEQLEAALREISAKCDADAAEIADKALEGKPTSTS